MNIVTIGISIGIFPKANTLYSQNNNLQSSHIYTQCKYSLIRRIEEIKTPTQNPQGGTPLGNPGTGGTLTTPEPVRTLAQPVKVAAVPRGSMIVDFASAWREEQAEDENKYSLQ